MGEAATTRGNFYRHNWLLLVCVLAASARLIAPFCAGRFHASFDLNFMTIPDRAAFSVALARGEFGFWYPLVWRGLDHLGYGETGMLHPFHLVLYRCLPLTWALAVEMLCPIPVLFAGTVVLCRRSYRLRAPAAVFGAAMLAFSIFPLAHFGQIHMCLIFAHLPWIVLAVNEIFVGRRPSAAAGVLALLYGSMFLLCHPQMPFLVSLGVGLAVCHRLVLAGFDGRSRRRLGLVVLAGVAGLLIGMAQLSATLRALGESERGHLSAAERGNYSLPPLYLLTNLSPGFFRDHAPVDRVFARDGQALGTFVNPSEFTGYFGLGLLVLIYAGFISGGAAWWRGPGRTGAIILTTGAVFALLLALGRYGGLHTLLGYVPLVSLFRSANRYKALLCAILALAGALTWQRLDDEPGALSPPRRMALFIPFVVSVGLSLRAGTVQAIAYKGNLLPTGRGWSLAWGPAVALAVPLLLLCRGRGRRLALAAAAAVCFVDLCGYGLPHVLDAPYRQVTEIRRLAASIRDGDHRYRWIAADNGPLWQGHWLATGYLGMRPPARLDVTREELTRLASVAAWQEDNGRAWSFPPPRLPRFRLVPNLVPAPDPAAAAAAAGADPRQTAFCLPGAAAALSGPALTDDETVTPVELHFDRLRLRVRCRHRRLLVISDRWSPGWTACVDGVATVIAPLYGEALSGVGIPAGEHTLELTYSPPALAHGLMLAAIGAVIALAMVLRDCIPRA